MAIVSHDFSFIYRCAVFYAYRLPLDLVEKEEINLDLIEINQDVLKQGEEEFVKFLKAINYLKECFQEKYPIS